MKVQNSFKSPHGKLMERVNAPPKHVKSDISTPIENLDYNGDKCDCIFIILL